MECTSIMKRTITLGLAGLVAFSASGCSGAESGTTAAGTTAADTAAAGTTAADTTVADTVPDISGDIVIYTSAEDAFMTEVVAMFNEKYPNAHAEYFRSGTEEVISKLMAEKMAGAVQADLIMVSDAPTFEMLKSEDLLVAYDSPELENIYEEYVDPEHMYYGTFPAAMGIMYNTDLVKEAPTSWKDLVSPETKDMAIMPNPLYSGTAANTLLELTRAEGLGWDYYQGLRDNGIMIVDGNGGVVNSVASGERAYGIVVDSNALAAAAKGSPVAFVYPEEGVPATADPIGIISSTDNLSGAQAFLDFMLQEEVQALGRELIGKTPVRKGMEGPANSLELGKRKLLQSDAKELYLAREDDKEKFKVMFDQ